MNILDKIKELYSNNRYDLAISLINKSEYLNQNPMILVWKARCLQLLNENVPNDVLEQVENCLKRALDLDSEHQEALIELAFFYLRVLDDARKARPLFEKNLTLIKSNAIECIIGMTECISDLETDDIALGYLNKNIEITLDVEKFNETRKLLV